jgi:DNA-binding response OmpR family regulator
MKKKIMIIEDDPAILLGLEASLEENDYEIISASDGLIGFHEAKKKKPDLLILDVMLPSKNGMEICRELRQSGLTFPVLLLTSKTDESDKVMGFDCGADDYVTKPFSLLELQARIKALLRRSSGKEKETKELTPIDVFEKDNIYIDFRKLILLKNGMEITLSAKEFQIIHYFIQHKGEVVTREMMLDNIWGYDSYPTTRTVDNYILNIRKAIEDDPSKPKYIQTIHTVGYKFNY